MQQSAVIRIENCFWTTSAITCCAWLPVPLKAVQCTV